MKLWSVIFASSVLFGALSVSATPAAGTKERLTKLSQAAAVQNGDASVYKYKVKGFVLAKAIKELNESLPNGNGDEGSCVFETTARRAPNLELLADLKADDSVADELVKLNKEGLMKYMISRANTEGESESCSIYRFEVYTTDGYVLYLNYDFTD